MTFLALSLIAYILTGQAQTAVQVPPGSIVVVTGKNLSSEGQSKVLAPKKPEEVQALLGKSQYRIVKQDSYTFVIQNQCIGDNALAGKKALLIAMSEAVAAGEKVVNLAKLPKDQGELIRDVVRGQANQMPVGLRHLVDHPNLKIALEPIVTATFEGTGRRRRASAYPVHDEASLLTSATEQLPSKPNPKPADAELRDAGIRFYFGEGLTRPSSRVKALESFGRWSKTYLEGEVAEFNASYDKALRNLFEAHRGFVGDGLPPTASDVSKLSPELRKSFERNFSGMFKGNGFDNEAAAETWFAGARMTSSSSYINLVVGGVEQGTGQNAIASIRFDRP